MAGGLGRAPALCRDCLWTGDAPGGRCPVCDSARLIAHAELFELSIAHLDCDAFYASVEKRDRPELADQPVIVGGGARGVVTTCCYIARQYGVRSAMPMFKARAACPHAVVIQPDFPRYIAVSRRIFAKLRALTPLVQGLSLDEAWLDLSGTERLHGGRPALVLARLQNEISADIGLPVSIGLAPNKFLAKIASGFGKPSGFFVVGAAEARSFLAPLPVGQLPGVGPAFAARLQGAGFSRVGELATREDDLRRLFGDQGAHLAALARGEDGRRVNPAEPRRSISAETTFERDLSRLEDLEPILFALADKVARRARSEELAGRVVTLKLRSADFRIRTRRRTLPVPCRTARTLFAEARALLRESPAGMLRLIGVGLTGLAPGPVNAEDFFSGAEARALAQERAQDALAARFGAGALVRARSLRQ
ncbi:MAG TPA: DNA polymerase IV [Caulobacteraceae bacterium]|nr:DNA polymerase IV [Caulobacteraceae bacterium]